MYAFNPLSTANFLDYIGGVDIGVKYCDSLRVSILLFFSIMCHNTVILRSWRSSRSSRALQPAAEPDDPARARGKNLCNA